MKFGKEFHRLIIKDALPSLHFSGCSFVLCFVSFLLRYIFVADRLSKRGCNHTVKVNSSIVIRYMCYFMFSTLLLCTVGDVFFHRRDSILPTVDFHLIKLSSFAASPRFVDSIRMQQTFIAWPARHTVRLKCKANGSNPLKFQWLKDGDSSIHRRLQPRLKTNMWYLKLKDLVPLDSGKYTCVVSNAYGSINHTYTLRVVGMYSENKESKILTDLKVK